MKLNRSQNWKYSNKSINNEASVYLASLCDVTRAIDVILNSGESVNLGSSKQTVNMADSTLDEIIKNKRINRFGNQNQQQKKRGNQTGNRGGNQGNRGGKQNRGGNQNGNANQGKAMKGRLFKEVQRDLGIKTKKPVSINTDARNKIIQKQRVKFTDARDRLAQIAKQGDARDKLNKMRKGQPGEKVVPQLKKTVVKKKIVNVPRQTFNVGQTRMKGNAVLRTVAGADPMRKKKFVVKGKPGMGMGISLKKTGFVTKGNRQTGRTHPIPNNPSVITIKNNHMQEYDDDEYEVVDYRQEMQLGSRSHSFAGGMGVPSPLENIMSMRSEPIARSRPVETVVYAREFEPEVRPSRLRITAANSNYRVRRDNKNVSGHHQQQQQQQHHHQQHHHQQQHHQQQQYTQQWQQPPQQQQQQQQAWAPPARMQQQRKREYYDDNQVEYQVYPKKVTTVPAPQVQSEAGTKVVVSNLHPCVSVEDMEELFGTIGSVLSVRMVRQGVAEAMFVSQEDAYRSVDLFNNRQLDGQPMKVMVVRKKAAMVTNSVQARSVLKNARGRSGYYVQ